MFINRCYNNAEDKNIGQVNSNMVGMNGGCCGNMCPPVMECPQERVCHTQTCYEVPHIIPINTRVINHHVYRHTYQPMYTCTMEDEVCNVYDQCNGNF